MPSEPRRGILTRDIKVHGIKRRNKESSVLSIVITRMNKMPEQIASTQLNGLNR